MPAFLTSSLRTGVVFLRICQRLSSISITKAAESIRAGDLSRRITGIATKDEVQELADTFNTMLEGWNVPSSGNGSLPLTPPTSCAPRWP